MVRKLKGGSSVANGQSDIIKRAQVMQQQMLQIQEGLKDKFVEESVAGGAIVVKANGQKEIVGLNISKDIVTDVVAEGTEELESLILSAINGAMKKAEELAEKEMSVVTGGVSIPGLF